MLKKILVTSTATLLLSGCLGIGDDESGNVADAGNRFTYNKEDFSINIMKDWEVIEKQQMPANLHQLVVSFQNNIKNEKFISNINIGKATLPEVITCEEFAQNSLRKIKAKLVGYKEFEAKKTEVKKDKDEIEAYVASFEGKQGSSAPSIRFWQLYAVVDKTGYVVTAAASTDETANIEKNMEEMLNSFVLK